MQLITPGIILNYAKEFSVRYGIVNNILGVLVMIDRSAYTIPSLVASSLASYSGASFT